MLLDEADFVHRANIVQDDLRAIGQIPTLKKLNTTRATHLFTAIYVLGMKKEDVNFIDMLKYTQNLEASP